MNEPPNADIMALASLYPEVRGAVEFGMTFEPQEGIDYSWLADYAKKRYEFFLKVFDDLDAKASSLITSGGSGTGILTAGTIAIVTTTTINIWIVLFALPAALCAFISLFYSIRARAIVAIYSPQRVNAVVDRVHFDHPASEKAQAYLIPQWHLCTAVLRPVISAKGKLVEDATWFFAWAVVLLAVPLLISIVHRLVH